MAKIGYIVAGVVIILAFIAIIIYIGVTQTKDKKLSGNNILGIVGCVVGMLFGAAILYMGTARK